MELEKKERIPLYEWLTDGIVGKGRQIEDLGTAFKFAIFV